MHYSILTAELTQKLMNFPLQFWQFHRVYILARQIREVLPDQII